MAVEIAAVEEDLEEDLVEDAVVTEAVVEDFQEEEAEVSSTSRETPILKKLKIGDRIIPSSLLCENYKAKGS